MNDIKKMYFTVSEVSEVINEDYSTVRTWVKKFSITPEKIHLGKIGHPVFSREQVALFHHIKRLRREEKYTIEGAKQKLREAKLI
ncbi:MAG TPA: helix-turn-helix domain-containing protein [Cyclobacteriaceae bacterium]|jgi:DNA-binding transcriptional MerR regulator|nr:helix-turn-helix domain-containing protein [Cyclobacteriaceae bacterium]